MAKSTKEKSVQPVEKPVEKSHGKVVPGWLRIVVAIVLLWVGAVALTWFVIWRQFGSDSGAAMEFYEQKTGEFYYSAGVMFLLMAVVAAITFKVFATLGLATCIASIMMYVNTEKMAVRNAPFLPDDLSLIDQTGEVAGFVSIDGIIQLVGGVVLIMAGTILLEIFIHRALNRHAAHQPWWQKHLVIPRLTYTMIALAALAVFTRPVLHGQAPEWVETMELVGWDQTGNYEQNGFIIGFLYNVGGAEIPEPEGYSKEAIEKIAERYQQIADKENAKRQPLSEVADNVIIILDETFYDPAMLTKYYDVSGGDVLPNLHKLFQKYPAGYMYSPEYGGNTANVEFEVQTGLSNYWANTMPYVTALPKTSATLSAASWAKEQGYTATAVHSYDGTMYKRNLVYTVLGYDQFIDRDKMKYQETEDGEESTHINDWSVFAEILGILKDNDSPQMVSAATMQNHSPYWTTKFDKLDFTITTTDTPSITSVQVNYQNLHRVDQYLGELTQALAKLDEKTVILWYGDHAAGLFKQFIQSDDKTDRDLIHLTPYFIWANFEIKSPFKTTEISQQYKEMGVSLPQVVKGVDLPITTPNCLQNTLYDVLGVQKPALFYLVGEVCEQTPILTLTYLEDQQPEPTQALKDYEMVNYDVLGGKHYWYGL